MNELNTVDKTGLARAEHSLLPKVSNLLLQLI